MKENKKITLLFITLDCSRSIDRSSYYLTEELSKITNLILWYENGDIKEVLSKIDCVPDFILLNDCKQCPQITGLSSISIPVGIIMCDLHYAPNVRKKFVKDNKIPYIFTICRDKFYDWYPEFVNQMKWLPFYVNTNIFKDYGLKKDIDCLLMGSITGSVYPLREKIYKTMIGQKGFVYHGHPGYRDINEKDEKSLFVGERYAQEINRSKIFFTCDSVFKYPVKKYYEVLACKTLLLASSSKELLDLGFLPGVHYVEIDENNFLEKANYYLQNTEERLKITEQGYKMVHEKYTTAHRAALLKEIINEILTDRKY